MKKLIVFFLIVPVFVSAKTFVLPNGNKVDIADQNVKISWIEKVWTLPSGYLYRELVAVPVAKADEETPDDKLKMFAENIANQYGISVKTFKGIIQCESGWDVSAKGDYRGGVPMANGILQFWRSTWLKQSEKYNFEGRYKNPYDQMTLGAMMMSDGGWDHWYNCFHFVKDGRWPD